MSASSELRTLGGEARKRIQLRWHENPSGAAQPPHWAFHPDGRTNGHEMVRKTHGKNLQDVEVWMFPGNFAIWKSRNPQ